MPNSIYQPYVPRRVNRTLIRNGRYKQMTVFSAAEQFPEAYPLLKETNKKPESYVRSSSFRRPKTASKTIRKKTMTIPTINTTPLPSTTVRSRTNLSNVRSRVTQKPKAKTPTARSQVRRTRATLPPRPSTASYLNDLYADMSHDSKNDINNIDNIIPLHLQQEQQNLAARTAELNVLQNRMRSHLPELLSVFEQLSIANQSVQEARLAGIQDNGLARELEQARLQALELSQLLNIRVEEIPLKDRQRVSDKQLNNMKSEKMNKLVIDGCCICMDDLNVNDNICKLYCKHIFHEICLKEWIQRSNVCPLCKQKVIL